jgi:hypothetical protein
MRITRATIFSILAFTAGFACSSSSDTGPAEDGGSDSSETPTDGSSDRANLADQVSSGDANGDATGSCNQASDCPGGGACANFCSDGTNPCARACVAHQCVARGCPDASLLDGQTWCNVTSDCPPNPGASCASVCSDGSNPCVTACVAHQCVARGCPDASATDAAGDATDTGDAKDAADAVCTGTRPNCFGNDVQMCCGQDPAGPASCVGGVWRCGTAPAPGCDGTSCFALDGSSG